MESKYNVTGGIYAEGSATEINSATDLEKAIKDGKKLYTEAYDKANNPQTADKIAVKGKNYAYVTKLYDKNGKEVTAQNIQDSKMQMVQPQTSIIQVMLERLVKIKPIWK